MKEKILSLLIALILTSLGVSAQNDNPFNSGPPPKVELGKCYAKCYIPTVYKTETETVISKEASTKLTVNVATFENGSERVMIKEAAKKFIYVPAQYKKETVKLLVKDAYTKLVPVAAIYETKTEKILIKEASTKWVMKKDKNCMSANPDDCFVACYEEVPEKYTTYSKRVLVTPATTKTIEVPAVYKNVTTNVISKAAYTKEVDIPAKFIDVSKRLLKAGPTTNQIEIPQKTKTITRRVLDKQGEYSDWREVLCGNKFTSSVNRQIQQALLDKGYDIGSYGVDDIIGKDTRAALMQFQRDKGLPVGNLNLETLDALGVKY